MSEIVQNGTGDKAVNHKCPFKFVSALNEKFTIPDEAPKCAWHPNADPKTSPHTKAEWRKTDKVFSNITKTVGNTPMVKLNKIPQSYNIECDVYVKCEFFNPGGSVKDRIGFRMIEDAEKAGLLKPGSTIIEPTSGNTGIGLAIGAAVKGYRCIIVISEKMSDEKVDVLKALGAEIVRTPIAAGSASPEGLFGVTHRLHKEIPDSIILDQVIGTGTGGTITGIGKKIKELSPSTVIVGADPEGSVLAQPESANETNVEFYEVEGIGYDFIPTGLNRSVVDEWVKTTDLEGLPMARRLIRDEGLLCGGSSGTAVAAAMRAAAKLKKGQKCVVLLPDSIRNYITKFVSDHWMEARELQIPDNVNNHWWWNEKVAQFPQEPLTTIGEHSDCESAMRLMQKLKIGQMPVVDKLGNLVSMLTLQKLTAALISGSLRPNDVIDKACMTIYPRVKSAANLGLVSRILEREPYVLVTQKNLNGKIIFDRPYQIITPIDFYHYIAAGNPK